MIRSRHATRTFGLILVVSGLSGGAAFAQPSCDALATLTIGTATITSSKLVPEGPYVPPARPGAPAAPTAAPQPILPAHCDVRGTIRPTSDSEIKFAMWMPVANWNGKYRQEGNGGWAGVIPFQAMVDPLRRGYVTAGTDDGHEGGGADWAVGHPEKLIDFGHRAVHEVNVHARLIIDRLYGRQPSRSYFMGCSDGGREGLMEAQRYPADFDGMVLGAPANRWSHLFTTFVWNELAQLETPESRIPAEKLPLLQGAAIAACDKKDGVDDGLIEDPRVCRFDPAALLCKGADSPQCLLPAQVEALQKIYGGPRNPRTGEQIYPGFPPGTEAANWPNWISAKDPTQTIQSVLGNPYYGQAVLENPKWDVRTMDFDKDFALGEMKAGPILNSSSPDLRSFRARNGKIIQYHGWGDSAIPAYASTEYYEAVRTFMSTYPDARRQGTGRIEDFYRLFLVPGMAHCSGGIGPHAFGTRGAVSDATMNDPSRDIFAALERWVEQGTAPEQFIGSGVDGRTPPKPITRPICLYPNVAKYKGSGDPNDAGSFTCAPPDAR
ncbi:MAG: tannase/feruloyl esterase family alpha/beta hydrolase [Vicinamibacterales bacterium]